MMGEDEGTFLALLRAKVVEHDNVGTGREGLLSLGKIATLGRG